MAGAIPFGQMPSQRDNGPPIESRIVTVRGHRVILDSDLAQLYDVTTKALLQAVRRNRDRFPDDFAFLLSRQEVANLRSQFVTSSSPEWGGRRYASLGFTEQQVIGLIAELSRRVDTHDAALKGIVETIQQLILPSPRPTRPIGFVPID